MLKRILSLITTILVSSLSHAQSFNDIIVTTSADTILCKITYVNEFNIFYTYKLKRKAVKNTHLDRQKIIFFSVSDTTVYVMEKQTPPVYIEPEKYSYKEENGIIYHKSYSTPPIYGNGLPNLNDFITKNVNIATFDTRAFQGQIITVLFTVKLDSLGYITSVKTNQEASTGTKHYDSRHLERNLIDVIIATKKWRPALINNLPVKCEVYLPLKFKVEFYGLFLLPSRNTFSLRNRG